MNIIVFGGNSGVASEFDRVFDNVVKIRYYARQDCDVRFVDQIEAAYADGPVDTVIDCAGILHDHPIQGDDPKKWLEVIETNLIGPYHIARLGLDAGVRRFVFLGSTAGLGGRPDWSSYCASKAGLVSLVQSLAREGHDAWCISPGRIDTKFRDRIRPTEDKSYRLRPFEVAEVVSRCLNGEWVSGTNIVFRRDIVYQIEVPTPGKLEGPQR